MPNTKPTLDDLIAGEAAAIPKAAALDDQQDWLADNAAEGQLAVDVVETDDAFLIVSAIAGVAQDDIDVAINRDMVTLRGRRREPTYDGSNNFLYRECYWGSFSRTIILPADVEADTATADLRNGVLTIRLPKRTQRDSTTIPIRVTEDDL